MLVSLARLSTSGCAGAGVTGPDASVVREMVGVTGFALAMVVPAASAVSDTASGSKNERFFTLEAPRIFLTRSHTTRRFDWYHTTPVVQCFTCTCCRAMLHEPGRI